MKGDPDGDLVRQAQAGSKAAFGKLVDRYYEMVYAVAYGILNHHEEARDAAQEALLKAFREIERFQGQSKFKTWLYRITVNAAIDQIRRRRPVEPIEMGGGEGEEEPRGHVVSDRAPGPREQASRAELGRLIREALEHLSPEHRAVLILREWEGLSYEEIAETLGIEMGTVMSRLFYAKKKLGEILGPKIRGEGEKP